jgi:hypothetical protein
MPTKKAPIKKAVVAETSFVEKEPVITNNTVSIVLRNALTIGIAFGWELTGDQTAALLIGINTVSFLVNTYLTRNKVTPVK